MTSPGDRLEALLAAVGPVRATVFGDFCLDAYWRMDPGQVEVSLETGLPVRRVRAQRYALGGAGNVGANLRALGVRRVRAVGLVGDDLFGRHLLELLAAAGVDCAGVARPRAGWQTPVYAKPLVRGAEGPRMDFGGFNRLAPDARAAPYPSQKSCQPGFRGTREV